ncbi:replication endonuclease [Alteromonas sp. a30]|uniref:replication endonuclease n=1 Tax=Alteromonas sp. a30 TaxID=2730917 RepID=UPI00227F2C1E|nr:replication endonuclease [Alteromonas sp. a30]MCY7293807.1 hypothetical protein [Alteromonas sp. a30]
MLRAQVKRAAKAAAQSQVDQKVAARALSSGVQHATAGINHAVALSSEDVALLRVKDGDFFKRHLLGQEELIPAFCQWGRHFVEARLDKIGVTLTLAQLKKEFEAHKERAFLRSWYGHFNFCHDDYKLRAFATSAAKKAALYIAKKGASTRTAATLRQRLQGSGIGLDGIDTLEGVLGRLCCEYWWRTQLRKVQDRRLEQLQRDLHYVGGAHAMYLSDVTFRKREIRAHSNRDTLENLYAVADTDEGQAWVNISDAAKGSQSNPVNRAAFMAVRIKGMCELADSQGLHSAFITITAPSHFHSVLACGKPNPKYVQGASASFANEWFKLIMSRIRADWQRFDLQPFGVRVAELHHDGCPHWHILLFAAPAQMAPIQLVMEKHALDGERLKNKSVRIDWRDIDPEKGDAVGYVIKYVAKGVDSRHLQSVKDVKNNVVSADDNATATLKMKYGLSVAGIQQFNFFGLAAASATVWQELRRFGQGVQGMQQVETFSQRFNLSEPERFALTMLYKAADSGDWATYCQAMGGIYAKRSEAALHILYSTAEAMNGMDSQLCALNRYGEPATNRVKGIKLACDWRAVHLVTRQHHYQVVTKRDYQQSSEFIMKHTLTMMDVWERAEYFQQLSDARYERYLELVDKDIADSEGLLVMEFDALYGVMYEHCDEFAPCGPLAAATEANLITLDLCQ